MKNLFLIGGLLCGLALVPACTIEDRRALRDDFGRTVGAPEHPDGSLSDGVLDGLPDYDTGEVILKGTEEAAKTGSPLGALIYIGGTLVAAGAAYLGRKLPGRVIAKVIEKAVTK